MRHKTRITNVRFYKCHQLAIWIWDMRHETWALCDRTQSPITIRFALLIQNKNESKKKIQLFTIVIFSKTKQKMQPNGAQTKHPYNPTANGFKK